MVVNEEIRKLSVYLIPANQMSKPLLVVRRTRKNAKGRFVEDEEILTVGLVWPSALASSREDMVKIIGETILRESECLISPRPADTKI